MDGRTDLFADPFLRPKSAPDDPVFCRISQSAQAVDCERVNIVYYPLSEKQVCAANVLSGVLKEDVDLLFLCSPDNPSGAAIPKDFLLEI